MGKHKMKVLVTGSKGFIGSHVYNYLDDKGFKISGADIKEWIDVRSYRFHEKYDFIFHLAANASIPQSINDPVESHSHNVVGTLRILEYAKKIGAKVIFSSSSSVYGEPDIVPIPEDSQPNPMIPYALQKLECEQYLWLYWKLYGVKSVALRYFNVFGEGQENANGGGDSSLALATFLKQKKNGEPLTIVGDGEQRRDFVYVKDVAEANFKAAEWLNQGGEFQVFNVGSGKNYSINEIAEVIDSGGKRVFLPARPEPKVGLADITKIQEMLDWKPKVSVVNWLKEQN